MSSEGGWLGVFTRQEVPGAIPNGTPVYKVHSEEGDRTPLGMRGTVLGSLDGDGAQRFYNPHGDLIRFAYFVEWADMPRVAVGVCDWKIAVTPRGAPCQCLETLRL